MSATEIPIRAPGLKRAARTLRWPLLALVILMVGLRAALDPLVRTGLERALSAQFGAPVSIAKVSAGMIASGLELEGLTVRNPPGFHPQPAMTIRRLKAGFPLLGVVRGKADLGDVVIEGITIRLETAEETVNLLVLLENLRNSPPHGSWRVASLRMHGVRIEYPENFGAEGPLIEDSLEHRIELEGERLSTAEIATRMLRALIEILITNAESRLPPDIVNRFREEL